MPLQEALLQYPPALNYEFPGLYDTTTLQRDVTGMRDHLATATSQLALERELAAGVHRARQRAIEASPALKLVYGFDDPEHKQTMSARKVDDMLSAAFLSVITSRKLPASLACLRLGVPCLIASKAVVNASWSNLLTEPNSMNINIKYHKIRYM